MVLIRRHTFLSTWFENKSVFILLFYPCWVQFRVQVNCSQHSSLWSLIWLIWTLFSVDSISKIASSWQASINSGINMKNSINSKVNKRLFQPFLPGRTEMNDMKRVWNIDYLLMPPFRFSSLRNSTPSRHRRMEENFRYTTCDKISTFKLLCDASLRLLRNHTWRIWIPALKLNTNHTGAEKSQPENGTKKSFRVDFLFSGSRIRSNIMSESTQKSHSGKTH